MVDSVKLRTSPYNIHHKLTADQEVNSSMGIGQGERLLGKDLAHRATDRMLNLTSVKVAAVLSAPPQTKPKV